MSGIVVRLLGNTGKYPGFENMNTEAAAEITRLRAELAAAVAERDRLREALKKITEYDLHWHPECRHDCSEIARTALKETT